MSSPLVTFALVAYNQERFIREAVEGALGQTYSPLEIFLSDDCSSDGTFEIIRQIGTKYRGPHRVVVSRNETNVGLGKHLSKLCQMSKGRFLTFGAGDDISRADRVEHLVKAWEENGFGAVSIYSSAIPIDAEGREFSTKYDFSKPCHPPTLKDALAMGTAHVVGATQGISRRLFDDFGEVADPDCHEDEVFPFRALLMDGIKFCPLPLVKYRHHASNWWSRAGPESPQESLTRLERVYRGARSVRKQWLVDYHKSTLNDKSVEKKLEKLIALSEHQLAVVQNGFFQSLIRILVHTIQTGSPRGAKILLWRSRLRLRLRFSAKAS
jgi:GT2 family glycosyltransferase